jgi:hypothetical protein
VHPFDINVKTTFKEEFVTCGGFSLQDIDPNTMMSKKAANPFFAGEVMDVDGLLLAVLAKKLSLYTNFPRTRGLIHSQHHSVCLIP